MTTPTPGCRLHTGHILFLTRPGKVLEKIITNRLAEVIRTAGNLSPRQFGFRPGSFTVDTVMQFVDAAHRAVFLVRHDVVWFPRWPYSVKKHFPPPFVLMGSMRLAPPQNDAFRCTCSGSQIIYFHQTFWSLLRRFQSKARVADRHWNYFNKVLFHQIICSWSFRLKSANDNHWGSTSNRRHVLMSITQSALFYGT